MLNRVLHPKVKWAALASSVVVFLTALVDALGVSLPPYVAALLTSVAAVVAGYQAPAGHNQDPEAPDA